MRAASVGAEDRAALQTALRYPPYELPVDMWRDLPAVSASPRRLALTPNPDGGVWVAHSAYLAKDTVGRDRSYFTHLLRLPTADTAAATANIETFFTFAFMGDSSFVRARIHAERSRRVAQHTAPLERCNTTLARGGRAVRNS